MDQPTRPADAPAIAKQAFPHRLAHRLAAEDDRFDGQKFGSLVQRDIEGPRQGRPVEEYGFLRQPIDPSTVTSLDGGNDFSDAAGNRLIDLLRCLRRDIEPRAGAGGDAPAQLVATR